LSPAGFHYHDESQWLAERAVTQDRRILVIGFGNMGQALVRGWLAKGYDARAIHVIDPEASAREVAARLGVSASATLAERAQGVSVIVLAVKPNQLDAVLRQCAAVQREEASVVLSIAAGKALDGMLRVLGPRAAVVRAMPNTPAAIGEGMTVLTASNAVTSEQRVLCSELVSAVGAGAWIDDEGQMDAVTALSGSGPAYVFLLIECLERAGRELGLAPALARQLATQTVAGAGAYARASDESAAQLRQRVTSPGGTTAAALEVLNGEAGMAQLISKALAAARARSRELSAA
jgi:pyrroline-5-carboxylate reductase